MHSRHLKIEHRFPKLSLFIFEINGQIIKTRGNPSLCQAFATLSPHMYIVRAWPKPLAAKGEEEGVSRKEENNGHLEGGETLYGKIKARIKYHACPKKDKE